MMDQLGITALRPGPSGNSEAPNAANYDPEKANPYPDLPELLVLKDGSKVTSADAWRKHRRPEIVEAFEREVVGRIPKKVPGVKWTVVTQATDRAVGEHRVNARKLLGKVDGKLAWRQHDGGHEDRTNMKYFIEWANRMLNHTSPGAK